MSWQERLYKLPALTQAAVAKELAHDINALVYIEPLINSKYPTTALTEDMTKAMIHAVKPYLYPEYAAKWPVFQLMSKRYAPAYGLGDYMTVGAKGESLGAYRERLNGYMTEGVGVRSLNTYKETLGAYRERLGAYRETLKGDALTEALDKKDKEDTSKDPWANMLGTVLSGFADTYGVITKAKIESKTAVAAIKAGVTTQQQAPAPQQIDMSAVLAQQEQQRIADARQKELDDQLAADKKKKLYWTIGLAGGGLLLAGGAAWLIFRKKKA